MTRKRLLNRTALVSLVGGLLMTGLPFHHGLLAQPTSSPAGQEMSEPTLVDQAIKHQIDRELSKHNALHNVRTAVQWQMVTLTGTVPSLADRDRASRAALDVVTGL